MSEHKINSMEYWDKRFQTNWEDYLGREQTVFFLQLLLENLPTPLVEEIEAKKYSICDAGCAEGDGTNLMATRFLNSDVLGIDFSIEAVNKARQYYPDVEYAQGDIMNLEKTFDVIVCSNVLEHFSKPFDIIPRLIDKATSHVVIMVPFLEDERIKEHLFTFEYDSFPLELNNYNLTYFKEIDCKLIEGTHWYGKQAILVYSNKEVLSNTNLTLESYKQRDEFYEQSHFQKIDEIEALNNKLEEKDQSIHWYHTKFEEKEQEINWYKNKIDEKDAVISKLTNLLEDNNKLLNSFSNETAEKKSQILELEQQLFYDKQVNYNLNQQITSMHNTKGWRILNKYYKLMNSSRNLNGHSKKFLYLAKTRGVKEAVSRSFVYLNKKENNVVFNNSEKLLSIYLELLNKYRNGQIKGIAIIPSAFEFDELYNQRTINLAKYLAAQNYAVIYVAWQWEKNELLEKNYQCFLDKIYQVPLFDFLETQLDSLDEFSEKKFIITFPAEVFYKLIAPLREQSFSVVYDIMDEWEEFYNTGESPWYKKEVEEAIILNSDAVFGVSEPLKEKFSYLRNDIFVNGNGYNENVSKMKNIALKTEANDQKIHLGYFGHMTPSWFDWELIFKMAENPKIYIHLIGYGADDKILKKMAEYSNIKYYGKVHPSELYQYVESWHIGLIPFKKSKLSMAVDPIKIYEYLYFGLPTVSTGIPHLGNYPLATHCEDNESVAKSIDEIYTGILENTLNTDNVEEFLENSTWDNRFKAMLQEVDQAKFYQSLFQGDSK